ncbi:hypothetical protein RclHR1_13570008 [Rhizophagus clarus]|uniref:Uncharacterized protein n=1 Tax=Rhizophagus clarus TaxID=94130 RepID=A0A2Z6R2S2_9GLOM|nr:hypothetical protein RclHR1_13570008 [Rhizophagus clarus]
MFTAAFLTLSSSWNYDFHHIEFFFSFSSTLCARCIIAYFIKPSCFLVGAIEYYWAHPSLFFLQVHIRLLSGDYGFLVGTAGDVYRLLFTKTLFSRQSEYIYIYIYYKYTKYMY